MGLFKIGNRNNTKKRKSLSAAKKITSSATSTKTARRDNTKKSKAHIRNRKKKKSNLSGGVSAFDSSSGSPSDSSSHSSPFEYNRVNYTSSFRLEDDPDILESDEDDDNDWGSLSFQKLHSKSSLNQSLSFYYDYNSDNGAFLKEDEDCEEEEEDDEDDIEINSKKEKKKKKRLSHKINLQDMSFMRPSKSVKKASTTPIAPKKKKKQIRNYKLFTRKKKVNSKDDDQHDSDSDIDILKQSSSSLDDNKSSIRTATTAGCSTLSSDSHKDMNYHGSSCDEIKYNSANDENNEQSFRSRYGRTKGNRNDKDRNKSRTSSYHLEKNNSDDNTAINHSTRVPLKSILNKQSSFCSNNNKTSDRNNTVSSTRMYETPDSKRSQSSDSNDETESKSMKRKGVHFEDEDVMGTTIESLSPILTSKRNINNTNGNEDSLLKTPALKKVRFGSLDNDDHNITDAIPRIDSDMPQNMNKRTFNENEPHPTPFQSDPCQQQQQKHQKYPVQVPEESFSKKKDCWTESFRTPTRNQQRRRIDLMNMYYNDSSKYNNAMIQTPDYIQKNLNENFGLCNRRVLAICKKTSNVLIGNRFVESIRSKLADCIAPHTHYNPTFASPYSIIRGMTIQSPDHRDMPDISGLTNTNNFSRINQYSDYQKKLLYSAYQSSTSSSDGNDYSHYDKENIEISYKKPHPTSSVQSKNSSVVSSVNLNENSFDVQHAHHVYNNTERKFRERGINQQHSSIFREHSTQARGPLHGSAASESPISSRSKNHKKNHSYRRNNTTALKKRRNAKKNEDDVDDNGSVAPGAPRKKKTPSPRGLDSQTLNDKDDSYESEESMKNHSNASNTANNSDDDIQTNNNNISLYSSFVDHFKALNVSSPTRDGYNRKSKKKKKDLNLSYISSSSSSDGDNDDDRFSNVGSNASSSHAVFSPLSKNKHESNLHNLSEKHHRHMHHHQPVEREGVVEMVQDKRLMYARSSNHQGRNRNHNNLRKKNKLVVRKDQRRNTKKEENTIYSSPGCSSVPSTDGVMMNSLIR